VGLVKILQEFQIPFLLVCDVEVLMKINGRIKSGDLDIKTSSLFIQLNKLELLSDSDKQSLASMENNITESLTKKWENSDDQLIEKPENSVDMKNRVEIAINRHKEVYDSSQEQEIRKLIYDVMKRHNIQAKILPGNFEEMFDPKNFGSLLQESKELYGPNKVLRGMHLASRTSEENIPSEIKDIVRTLEALHNLT
jgi:hypothetical protein